MADCMVFVMTKSEPFSALDITSNDRVKLYLDCTIGYDGEKIVAGLNAKSNITKHAWIIVHGTTPSTFSMTWQDILFRR